ncbi:type IV toxin-antitoxin system AbiEi family antitoxin domain-containing protein (plasmid) [Deinococcus taeanensis]|uniref:type IV toxin-antitoxin system AbiEi family antitoxin domain-containing protein n=1 Tax=Deinococcus taeanensis TaxID=2737050 RepID=UPI001CDCB35C|nr:type IV toxin-antitoxin system AbiEi family antitoxin domain-containing protein [Deinococcus taeanensis]UBV44772.1 type IV toxin-antitoxin system AbiEi family antitoxin domain-containing protein [Deinococcus taeanensis]
MTDPQQALLQLFQAHGGYLTSQDVRQASIPTMYLTLLERQGVIERLQRGVYRHPEAHTGPTNSTAVDLLEVQLRVPFARPCLATALNLHGLTTTRPAALQFAIPANKHFPDLDSPQVDVFYFRPKAYQTGVVSVDVAGRALQTYSPEKTLVDLLRYAPKYGRELYLEGLKKYLQRRLGSPTALLQMAKTLGQDQHLRRDLEVLLHDQDH